MNAMALQPMMAGSAPIAAPRWLGNGLAAGCALALHGAVALALLANWQLEPPAPQPAVLKTQLVMLPAPLPEPVSAVAPAPAVPEPVPVPVQAAVEPAPAPVAPPKPDPAVLARKRVQEREREQAKVQKQHQEQQEQEQWREREREQAEQQARSAQQAEQARQQQLADAAKAKAQAAELASRQYLPISKDAPDYPQRALDKGIQGDCTVEYQVNSLGRVENPQVVGSCHPMFIRPSLAAAKTFVYQPRVVDGKAVQVPGVRNTFHYRIE